MKTTGKEFVAAIIAILRMKNKKTVSFDPKTYDSELTKDELPWCMAFDRMVDTIGSPALVIRNVTLENTSEFNDEDKRLIRMKGLSNCIWICVKYDGDTKYEFFNGTEDENWEHLFFDVYDELRKADDEEADMWLDRFLAKYRENEIKSFEIEAYRAVKKSLIELAREYIEREENKEIDFFYKKEHSFTVWWGDELCDDFSMKEIIVNKLYLDQKGTVTVSYSYQDCQRKITIEKPLSEFDQRRIETILGFAVGQ